MIFTSGSTGVGGLAWCFFSMWKHISLVIWLPSSIFMLVSTGAVMATSSCSLFTPEMYLNSFINIWLWGLFFLSLLLLFQDWRAFREATVSSSSSLSRRSTLCTPISHLGTTSSHIRQTV